MGSGEESHRDGVTVSAHRGEGAHRHRSGHLAKAVPIRCLLPPMLFPPFPGCALCGGKPPCTAHTGGWAALFQLAESGAPTF